MKKSAFLVTILLLSSTLALIASPVSAATYAVTEFWSNPMGVLDVAMSDDGNYVAAVNGTGVYFFSKNSNQPLWWFEEGQGAFWSVAISAKGDYVAAGYANQTSKSGRLFYFNESTTANGPRSYTWRSVDLYGAVNLPRLVAISDDGRFVVVGGNNQTDSSAMFLIFANSTTLRFGSSEMANLSCYKTASVASVDISADGRYVVAGGPILGSPWGWVWFVNDTYNLTILPAMWIAEPPNLLSINDLALSDDGYAVVAVSYAEPDTLYYWKDAKTLGEPNPWPNPAPNWTNLQSFTSVDMNSDGNRVVAGNASIGTLHFWDNARTRTGTDEPEKWTRLEGRNVLDVGLSDDGNIAAASCANFTAQLFEAYFFDASGGLIGNFTLDSPCNVVSVSGNGQTVGMGGAPGTLYLFGIKSVRPVGGEVLALDGPELIAPYLVIALVLSLAAASSALLIKRRP